MPKLTPRELFEDILRQCKAKQTGTNSEGDPQYQGICPTHNDGSHGEPSLSLTWSSKKETPLLDCKAGGETPRVVHAFGYAMAMLFKNWRGGGGKKGGGGKFQSDPDASYQYHNKNGNLVYEVCRFGKEFPMRRPGKDGKGWIWNGQGIKKIIYRLPEVLKADQAEIIHICEGKKDVDQLCSLGLIATCNPGGASASSRTPKWKDSFSEPLAGRNVIILPDNDDPGFAHARHVTNSVAKVAASVKIVSLPGLENKDDVSDWLDAGCDPAEFPELAEKCEPVVAEESNTLSDDFICNYVDDGDSRVPISMAKIKERIKTATGDWPRRVGKFLFAPKVNGSGIDWFDTTSALFGFLARDAKFPADFSNNAKMASKGEVCPTEFIVDLIPLCSCKIVQRPTITRVTEVRIPADAHPVQFKSLDVEFGCDIFQIVAGTNIFPVVQKPLGGINLDFDVKPVRLQPNCVR